MKCLFQIADSDLYNFSFDPIDSRMYVLISDNRALIIDPCIDKEALKLLRSKEVKDIVILPTHEHYDHISGINWFRKYFNCNVIASEQCSGNLANPKLNASAHFDALFVFASDEDKEKIAEKKIKPYICSADEVFNRELIFNWQNHKVELHETPGHSKGSICIVIDGEYLFTGDSLIKGIPVITRLPGGNRREFNDITLKFLKKFHESTKIFPGHGDVGLLSEFSI